jgi:putative aldouronate transport system substrate-binding protein
MSHLNAERQAGLTRRRFISDSSKALAVGALGTGSIGSLLAACGGSSATPSSGPTTVTYTFIAFSKLTDAPAVSTAMSNTDKLKKLNIKVSLNPIDSASYDQKLQLGYAAGQTYDMVFTAPWANNYTQNALKGNFLALDDLLPQYAPELYRSMPPAFWDAVRVNGKIYGVPNQNYFAYVFGLFLVKKYADKYKDTIPATITSYADIEPFLAAVKQNEPNVTPVYMTDTGVAGGLLFSAIDHGIDAFAGTTGLAGIYYTDKNLKVFNVFESPEYQQAVELRWRWKQLGYFRKDPVPAAVSVAQVQAGEYAMLIGQQAKPNDIPTIQQHFGIPMTVKQIGTPFLTTNGLLQNMNSIVRTSQHPNQVMQFMNVLNNDAELFNLLCHGIEGKHYVFVNKAEKLITFPTGLTATTDPYNPGSDWMFGNEQNGYYTDPNSVGVFANIQQANNTATRSTAFGFTFDPTNVKTEIAQLNALIGPIPTGAMPTALQYGKLDPQKLPSYLSQLKQAGADTVVAQAQKQLDAWASKHK